MARITEKQQDEKSVEKHLVGKVKRHGGICIKLLPFLLSGLPDRIVLLPGGRIWFVELKRPKGGVFSGLQIWWGDRLKALGFQWHGLHTKQLVDQFFTNEVHPL